MRIQHSRRRLGVYGRERFSREFFGRTSAEHRLSFIKDSMVLLYAFRLKGAVLS